MADDTIEQAKARVIVTAERMAAEYGHDLSSFRKEHANLLDAIDALIAAVLATYTLTDSDVDKFLAACEAPVDPERVERIRKLFLEKLHKE